MRALVITISLLAGIFQLSAQTIINDAPTDSRAYTRFGIEPTTMLAFGYQRNLDVGVENWRLTVYGEWSSSLFRFGIQNSELKVGGIVPLVQSSNFKVVNNLGFSVGNTTNTHFESTKFSIANEIAAGLYKAKWFLAGTFEYEKIFRNKVVHTDFYRTTYYPEARDGWYKGAGGMLQFGIEGGRTFNKQVDVHMELKFPFTEKLNSYGGSPAHINLGVGYRF